MKKRKPLEFPAKVPMNWLYCRNCKEDFGYGDWLSVPARCVGHMIEYNDAPKASQAVIR